jgi:hypothetical protein
MRFILHVHLIIFSLLLTATHLLGQSDFVYETEEGKFSIDFPAKYNVNSEEKGSIRTAQAMCAFDEHTLLATYTLHATEITDHDALADTSIVAFGNSVNGNLLSKTDWVVDGKKGRKAFYNLPEQNIKVEYRVLLVGQLQYQIIVMATNAKFDNEMAVTFFDSFRLK